MVDDDQPPLEAVVECEVHEAYQVEHRFVDDLDWDLHLATDPAAAARSYLEALAADVVGALDFGPGTLATREPVFVGRLPDGGVHAVLTISADPTGSRWAVTHAAYCTSEQVPEADAEDPGQHDVSEGDLFES